jgi:hypothetical protein
MKRNKQDILNILSHFQSKIQNEPPVEKMYQEVQMMNFKIKPVQGDVSIINFNNKQLVGVLWRLGKLDEFFHQEFNELSPQQKKILINFFDSMHDKYQQQLNHLDLKVEKTTVNSPLFEMEIFKEQLRTKKIN